MASDNDFKKLCGLDVSAHVEKKNGLNYLSWAYAWQEFKQRFPAATYEIMTFENNQPYVFDPRTGYMVFTKIVIDGLAYTMWLPVMDSNNNAMKAEPYEVKTKYKTYTVAAATMFDINKTIMRCLAKNIAMASGIGLYLYSDGTDMPEETQSQQPAPKATAKATAGPICKGCKRPVEAGQGLTAEQVAAKSTERYGAAYCNSCRAKKREAASFAKAQAAAKAEPAKQPDDEAIELPFPLD